MAVKLAFVLSPPRAGSTLLQRMLAAHSQVASLPEPHLLTPLAHLGVWRNVDAAPYDHINASEAQRAFVERLPGKDRTYFDALRRFTDGLYEAAAGGCTYFLDKTPAYALVWPFIQKLYPDAHFIVLTRHPLAVFSSYAHSFFAGDWAAAHRYNPVLERYVPALATALRSGAPRLLHLQYETVVSDPAAAMRRAAEFLEVDFEPAMVDYGGSKFEKGAGDPITVNKQARAVTSSLAAWQKDLHQPENRQLAYRMRDALTDEDLEAWGTNRRAMVPDVDGDGVRRPPRENLYTLQRRALLALRKDVDRRWHGRALRRVKYYCDVILRDAL